MSDSDDVLPEVPTAPARVKITARKSTGGVPPRNKLHMPLQLATRSGGPPTKRARVSDENGEKSGSDQDDDSEDDVLPEIIDVSSGDEDEDDDDVSDDDEEEDGDEDEDNDKDPVAKGATNGDTTK